LFDNAYSKQKYLMHGFLEIERYDCGIGNSAPNTCTVQAGHIIQSQTILQCSNIIVQWLGGVSCLSAAWYFGVLALQIQAWFWTSYSRSDNHCGIYKL